MARVLAKTLIGAAALLTVSVVPAQGDAFAEAVKQYRLGNLDAAKQKLEEVLASDPSHEQAFELYKKTDAAVWRAFLLEQGEINKIARHLLDLAKVGSRERSRDQQAIGEAVAQATAGDYAQRSAALGTLVAEYGEFAVPALVSRLGNADDDQGQVFAIMALERLGRAATLPLVEALKSDDPLVRRNAAAALGNIRDERALPALARLAALDASDAVKDTAARILQRAGVEAAPLELYLTQADRYLADSGVRETDRSDVVWTWQDGELVSTDVPAVVYNFELAKKAAHEALALDPSSEEANVSLARAYLGQAAAISESLAANPDDAALAALGEQVAQLRNTAAATGLEVVRRAVLDSIEDRMTPMAVAGIELLGEMESRDELASSPLVAALDHSDKRIGYAAALAMVQAGAGSDLPAADRVVANLASAVQEEALLRVQVIDQDPLTQKAVAEASMKRGTVIAASESALDVMNDLYSFPDVDVVVLNENISDARPEAIIGLIRKDPRMQHIKILVVAEDPDAAAERFGERINGTIKGPVTAESLQAEVEAALADVAPDARRARATRVAVAASNALEELAAERVDVRGALDSLAAQLTREDAVAVPAAQAIGYAGAMEDVAALLAVVGSDTASLDLKVACVQSAGSIFSRNSMLPEETFDALLGVATSDADMALRSAAVRALGKAELDGQAKVRLIDALRVRPEGAAAAAAAAADG